MYVDSEYYCWEPMSGVAVRMHFHTSDTPCQIRLHAFLNTFFTRPQFKLGNLSLYPRNSKHKTPSVSSQLLGTKILKCFILTLLYALNILKYSSLPFHFLFTLFRITVICSPNLGEGIVELS